MQNRITPLGCLALKNRMSGFTLMELMITIVIVGILAAAAAPYFGSLIATQRVKSASFDLIAALTQTRSEAIKRNDNVSMTAADGDWKNGWTITSGALTLSSKSAYKGLTIEDSDDTVVVTFRGNGRLSTDAINLTVANAQAGSNVNPRCISLSLSGRASSKIGSCA